MKRDTYIFLALNIIAFSVVGFLYFYIHKKEQTSSAVLASHITMGTVEMKVGNFTQMKDFYTSLLGMQVLSSTKDSVTLGYGQNGILRFINAPQLPKPSSSDPGLDQLAIVFTSREGLARALQRVLVTNPSSYLGGTSRGAVGEAFYVTDPMGNTLELYYDTDPSTWQRSSRGNVEGDATPIDSNRYIANYATEGGDNGMKTGHVQIRIGNILQGKDFYVNILGLYIVPQLLGGKSLFLSDGFYHHDLVINEAQGYDGDPITHYLGLSGLEIGVPNTGDIDSLKKRLSQAGIRYTDDGKMVTFSDPWGIQIHIKNLNAPFWQELF